MMADGTAPIDGVRPTAPPAAVPMQSNDAPVVRKWKWVLMLGITAFTFLYLLWCLLLLAMLPSADPSTQSLVPIGVASTVLGGIIFLAVGAIGFFRIMQTHAAVERRQVALVKLLAVTVPGMILSFATPFLIMREPSLVLEITSPATPEELIAPVAITFSAEQAVDVLRQRGINPIQFRWDITGDRKMDQETLDPLLTATFDRDGIYTVSVTIVGSNKETRVASNRFIIEESVFSIAPPVPIIDQPVIFSLAHLFPEASDVKEVQWDFDGDGTSDETTVTPAITHTFYRTGEEKVVATVFLQNNTQQRYVRNIVVREPEEPPFPVQLITEPKHLISSPPFPVLFRIETEEPIVNVQWQFGDGERAEGEQIVHTFSRNGNFAVTARVESEDGEVANLGTVVQVVSPLRLSDLTFEGTPEVRNNKISGEVPLTINLKPRTATSFVEFLWEAPEATEVGSTDTTLQAIYRRQGTYTITLVAQDSEDRVLRLPITVEVTSPEPSVSFEMDPDTGVAPLRVRFDASESFVPGETISGFVWRYGDGTPQQVAGAQTEHLFQKAGTYTITVTVQTTNGEEYRAEKVITVRQSVSRPCIILPSRTSGSAPLPIEFSSQCNSDPTSYLWDFGDDSQSDRATVTHVFTNPGTYIVTLTTTGGDGSQLSSQVTVTVNP